MDLLQQTKQLCRLYNIKPARSKGQNFLIKESVYDKIIETADLGKEDIVLEVGSGLGFLTTRLAKKVKKVIAVELDNKLARILQTKLKSQGIKNVEVVNEDILTSPLTPLLIRRGGLKGRGFKIVANLPYNITSRFLRKFLSTEFKSSLMVLMVQKEVAERIVARPSKMSLLAVSVQFYARPKIIQIVPASSFWPKPKVDSAIIKLEVTCLRRQGSKKFEVGEDEFFRLVRIGFSAKRKMLKNNLANGYHISTERAEKWLKIANFSPKIRAQGLSVKEWVKLFEVLRKNML